jgi:hypothetical protein
MSFIMAGCGAWGRRVRAGYHRARSEGGSSMIETALILAFLGAALYWDRRHRLGDL